MSKWICFLSSMFVTILALQAQESSEQIRSHAWIDQRRSDSLKKQGNVLWKRSDSMRIESVLLRMRSDSLGRAVKVMLAKADLLDRPLPDSSVALDSDSSTLALMAVETDTGLASYYAEAFHGRKTSNGESYDMNDLTCAHRWLPFNTRIRVTNLANGRTVVVRVNDRGPWKHTRLIDVSKGAAKELDMIRMGTTRVELKVLTDPE